MTPTALDSTALAILKEVHNLGAGLYNAGDPVGAFRLYEGALRACSPFLPHRPAVQQRIRDGLAEVDKTDGGRVRAFRLHELMEEVRADLKATRTPRGYQPPPPSTVWTKDNLTDGLITTAFDLPADFPGLPGADERPS